MFVDVVLRLCDCCDRCLFLSYDKVGFYLLFCVVLWRPTVGLQITQKREINYICAYKVWKGHKHTKVQC